MKTKVRTDDGIELELEFELGRYVDLVANGRRLGTFGQDAPLAEPLVIAGVPYWWLYRMGGQRVGVVPPGSPGRCYLGCVLVGGNSPYGEPRLPLYYDESES